MKAEKTIRRPDGTRVRITVHLSMDMHATEPNWHLMVHTCGKGKRLWIAAADDMCVSMRRLSFAERRAEIRRRCLAVAGPDEVRGVMLDLWLAIKPGVDLK